MHPPDEDITTEEMRRQVEATLDNLSREVLLIGKGYKIDSQAPRRLPSPRYSPKRIDNRVRDAMFMAVLLGLCNVGLFGVWGLVLLSAYLSELSFLETREEPYNAHIFDEFHFKTWALIFHAMTLSLMPPVRHGISWAISAIAALPHLSTTAPQTPEVVPGLIVALVICLSIVGPVRQGSHRMPKPTLVRELCKLSLESSFVLFCFL